MNQQLTLDFFSPPPQTINNFVGNGNTAVLTALRQSIQPGRAIYIWGASGSGRTHLLRASVNAYNGIYCNHISCAENINSFLEVSPHTSKLIAIDDVNLLDTQGQEALFKLYNRWREIGRAVNGFTIITSGNQSATSLDLREDLRTRIAWDLSFRLHNLSDEERLYALREQAKELGMNLTKEVSSWLLSYCSRDMRYLTAVVSALDRYSIERHRPITVPLLKELLMQQNFENKT